MNGKTLEEVNHFRHLRFTQTTDGTPVKEVEIRLAQAHSAMRGLAVPWKNKAISFPTKIKLHKSLDLSILLYGCVSWTLTADLERQIQAFENKCYRRMLFISYREHKTIEYAWQQVNILAGRQEFFSLSTVKRCKLSRFGHVCRYDMLPKIIPQGTVDCRLVIAEEDLVNHGRTTSRNGQASICHHCCASRITEVDGQSWQRMRLSQYLQRRMGSRVLVS